MTKKANQECNKQCNALFSLNVDEETAILYSELWAAKVPQTFRPEIPTSGGVPHDMVRREVATYECQSEMELTIWPWDFAIWGICFNDFGTIKSRRKKKNKAIDGLRNKYQKLELKWKPVEWINN